MGNRVEGKACRPESMGLSERQGRENRELLPGLHKIGSFQPCTIQEPLWELENVTVTSLLSVIATVCGIIRFGGLAAS